MKADAPALLAGEAGAWAALLDGLPEAAWMVDLEALRVVAANAAAASLFGRTAESLVGEAATQLAGSPEDLAYWADAAAGERGQLQSDTVVATADGRALHVSRSIRPIAWAGTTAAATPLHALVVLFDRSAERRAENERELLLGELQSTLEATADGILVTDLAGRVRAFNRRFAEIWAMPLALLQERDDAGVLAWMVRSVVDAKSYESRLHALRDAAMVTASDRIELHSGQVLDRVTRPLFLGGSPQGRVYSFRDLSERIAAQERIDVLSRSDALTGLANRARLAERVSEAAAAVRRAGGGFALLVVDLDRFRRINDSLGQDTGDRVLLDVAQRIQGCLRQEDTLARLGGDQFALLLGRADAPAAEATARRVLQVVAQPFDNDGVPFTLTCSIGIALAPSHGSTLNDLARHADTAMRAVKADGRANFRLHQLRTEVDRRQHIRLDHAMRQALVSNRFRLHYQPQVSLADGRIVGAEALLRWRDPEHGDMSPVQFIPVAEDSGFIVALGDWVLTQAVRQAALWHQRGHAVPVSINVSALQFRQSSFADRVGSVLAVSGLPAQLLELELTESILVHDADEALQRLHALAALGVRLSIDDFGTGYSSLAYLKRFPIGKLKIDRSFVAGLPADGSDAGIVCAIVQMARALGMTVIAEGVETEAQRQFLHDAGCDEFQGWLFAPALDSLSFEQRLVTAAAGAGPGGVAAPPRIRLIRG
ncbi:MAG: EAL domain-containing protein [Rubrivivax sp.]|nr:EAL domain-containing protein [Rubrivivax sp.]